MVNQIAEERSSPQFSLTRIRELARGGCVRYAYARVTCDIENLGYSPDDVQQCLASLEERHFRRSIRYEEQNFWLDEYLITYDSPSGCTDNLYIKLKLNRDCILILLSSFHRER